VSAKVEEIIVNPDWIDAQDLTPNLPQLLFDRIGRSDKWVLELRTRESGCGNAPRFTLPLGATGKLSSATNAEGIMYASSILPEGSCLRAIWNTALHDL
jgi:hypothetical protein